MRSKKEVPAPCNSVPRLPAEIWCLIGKLDPRPHQLMNKGVCVVFVWYMLGICVVFVWYLCDICVVYVVFVSEYITLYPSRAVL